MGEGARREPYPMVDANNQNEQEQKQSWLKKFDVVRSHGSVVQTRYTAQNRREFRANSEIALRILKFVVTG
jgi:hypothetical protein